LENKSLNLFLFAVFVITAALVIIPVNGIIAETDSVTKVQWPCCSSEENEENKNSHTIYMPISEVNQYFI
jgi:hypothetical protein